MEQNTCNKCGRPMQYATEPKCNYCDACMSEYCGCKLGRIKEVEPTCDSTAVIPSITVESVEGITNLANCLVHVKDINTTFYVDDKHRVMITWAGPVDIPGYDMSGNPQGFRDQIVTDIEASTAVIYDKHGNGFLFGITAGSLQDAVNDKLDQMAADGTLGDIISTYLVDGIHGFDNVAALALADNLTDGGFVKTYGYKRLGDGVYNLYKVRTPIAGETYDGYNKVSLANSDNLVAERVQTGKELVIKLNAGDNLQDYLSLQDKKTIFLPANSTYTITQRIFVNSDTTLDLNNSTLYCNYVDSGETFIFLYGLTDTFTKYNGYKNITFRNGTIEKACINMMHNKNVLIENVEFIRTVSRHSMQIAGSYNVTIKSCIFNGTEPINVTGSECINIDPCNYGGQPYMSQDSPMYDHTANQHIEIINNTFYTPSTAGFRYTTAIGSHGGDDNNQTICEGLVIKNNDLGAPYASAINVRDYKEVNIDGNKCIFDSQNMNTTSYFVYMQSNTSGVTVANNTVEGPTSFIYQVGTNSKHTGLDVVNNTVTTNDTLQVASLALVQTTDSSIKDNVFHYTNTLAIMDSKYSSGNPIVGTECDNVIIANNLIDKTDNASENAIRVRAAKNIYVDGNNFAYLTLDTQGGFAMAITPGLGQSNIRFTNNKTRFPRYMLPNGAFQPCLYASNNDSLSAITPQYDFTDLSGSGTFTIPTTYLDAIVLQIGASAYSNTVEITPWLLDSDKFSGNNLTWKIPVVKGDDTLGSVTLVITNDGKDFSWSGDVSIRRMYAKF